MVDSFERFKLLYSHFNLKVNNLKLLSFNLNFQLANASPQPQAASGTAQTEASESAGGPRGPLVQLASEGGSPARGPDSEGTASASGTALVDSL